MISLETYFYNLKSPRDVANLLDISYPKLNYYLYKIPDQNKYSSFDIKKKSGGTRNISAPIPPLLYLQKNLLNVLHEVYKPRPSVHGAIRDRNIVTNAYKHKKSRFIINFDIKDFFPSIHYGRVKGMFCAHPYSLPKEIAHILANICCYQGKLPQGSPTSPMIANMICHGMDREFQRLSKKHSFYYTRYFDDITFSTKQRSIPNGIAYSINNDGKPYALGKELLDIVEGNGFNINHEKTRIYEKTESQIVTGLKVNKFPNVDRRYIRQLRAMLHAWERFGHDNSQQEYIKNYDSKHRQGERNIEYRRVVKGKIDFLKMVRGGDNEIYIKMIKKYRILEARDFGGNVLYKRPLFSDELLKSAIFVIDFEWKINGEIFGSQGTAFALKDYGIITCAHVLPPDNAEDIQALAWRCDNVSEIYNVEIIKKNKDLDLAILSINATINHPLIIAEWITFLGRDSKIIVAGFPKYTKGDDIYISSGHVTQRRKVSGIDRIIISVPIIEGNSGGPVLNDNHHVVGIAATGFSGDLQYGATHYHSFIPVSALSYLK